MLSLLSIIIIVCCCLVAISASALSVDITRLTFIDGVTYKEASPELRFVGTLSAGRSFNISSITVPAGVRVVIDISSMGDRSSLNLRNITFPQGLHVLLRPQFVLSDYALNLEDVHVACTSSLHLCPNVTDDNSGSHNNGTFAFLLEVPPLSAPSVKNSAGTLSVSSVDSSFAIQDDGSIATTQSLVAFAVQHQRHRRIADPTAAVGFGYSPSARVHGTRMPFVAVSLRSSVFRCDSDRGAESLGAGHSPDFVGCIALGTGNRTVYAQHAREQSRARRAARNTDYNGVTWRVALLFSVVDLWNLTVSGKCSGPNCIGIVLAESVFKRARIVDSTVEISVCAQDCAALAVLDSYGDNFTAAASASAATSPTTSAAVANSSSSSNASSHSAASSFSVAFPSDPATTVVIIARNALAITQTTDKALPVESCTTGIVLRYGDIRLSHIYSNSGTINTDRSHARLLFTPYITRGEWLIVSASTFTSTTRNGFWQSAAIQLQTLFAVRNLLVEDLAATMSAGSTKLAGIGFTSVAHFDSFVLQRLSFNIDVSATSDDAGGIVFAYLKHGPGVYVWDVNLTYRAGKNHVLVFFDDALVENVTEIAFERIDMKFTGGLVANGVFSNSSFVDVDVVRLSNFTMAVVAVEGTDLTGFVATLLMIGPRVILIEHGTATMNPVANGGLVNCLSPGNSNPHNLLLSQIIFRSVTLDLLATLLAAGLLISLGSVRKDAWGADAISVSYQTLQPAQPIVLSDCTLTLMSRAALSSLLVMQNIELESIVLRGTKVLGASVFFMVVPMLLGAKANVLGIDASGLENPPPPTKAAAAMNSSSNSSSSSSSPSSSASSSSADWKQWSCSQFGPTPLIGRRAIVQASQLTLNSAFLKTTAPQLAWTRQRHCGDTYSASRSSSDTYLEQPKPSRTGTWQNRTNTTTRTKSRSSSISLLPPELDLATPAAANGVSATAALSGLMGGAGASLALDAARAMAVMSLVARCKSFRDTDKGLEMQQRKEKFYNKYLVSKPGFPQNIFPFICIGPERGACIRGATVSNIIFLSLMTGLSYWLGSRLLAQLRPTMDKVRQQHESAFKYGKVPFFVGMSFAFVIGPWSTQVVVMLSVPELPDSDAILAILSLVIWLCIIGTGFLYLFYPRLSVFVATEAEVQDVLKKSTSRNNNDDDEDEDENGRKKKKKPRDELSEDGQKRAVGSIWRCEESFTSFLLEDPFEIDRRYELQQIRLRKKALREAARRRSFATAQRRNKRGGGGGKVTVATLMQMPQETDDDELFSDDELEELEENLLSPSQQRQQRRSSSAAAAAFSDEDEAVEAYARTNRLGGAGKQRSSSSSNLQSRTPPISPSLGPRRSVSSPASSSAASSPRNKKRKQQQQLLSPKSMKDLLLQQENIDDSVLLQPASKFHHFVWAASQFLPSFLGRIAFLGHFVWLEDGAMAELGKLKKKSGGVLQESDGVSLGKTEAGKKPPCAGGAPGGVLWNCGTLVNKYRGPYTRDVPLTEKRSKKQRESESHLLAEKIDFGGVRVRRYHHADLRLRVSPYWAFVSLTWTLSACMAQGVALSDPERCTSTIVAIVAINGLAFAADCYFRPYIVPSRNVLVIFAGFWMLSGSCIAAFVSPENGGLQEMGQAFMMIFVVSLLCVSLFNLSLKFILFFGKGSVILRREMLRRLETVLTKDKKLEVGAGGKFVITEKRQEEPSDDEDAIFARHRANHASVLDSLWGNL